MQESEVYDYILSLPLRPRVRSRNGSIFLTIRGWSARHKKRQIEIFKSIKCRAPKALVDFAAKEIANFIVSLVGCAKGFIITNVPCGHSNTSKCLSFRIANAVASLMRSEYVKLWRDRPQKGTHYPKPQTSRPGLEWIALPLLPVILVDDIMTSGSHLEECLQSLRDKGIFCIGIAWIGTSLVPTSEDKLGCAGRAFDPLPETYEEHEATRRNQYLHERRSAFG